MQLKGRNLRARMKGDDVRALHRALRQLDFVIADDELEHGRFGKSTRRAVLAFQKAHNIRPSGEVDEETASALRAALASPRDRAESPPAFVINGRVVDRVTQQGIPGLRVQAWDKDLIFDDLVAETLTDRQGRFRMALVESTFRDLILDQKPDLFFKVFQEETLLHSTQDQILWNVQAGETEIVIDIDIEGTDQEEPPAFSLSGYIRTESGLPVPEVLVEAFDKKVSTEPRPLGEASTDGSGHYNIVYTDRAIEVLGDAPADLFIQASRSNWDQDFKSSLLINASHDARINLTVPSKLYRAPSEFEQIQKRIEDLVDADALVGLGAQDIEYLAAKLDLGPPRVERYIHAWRLAAEAGEYSTGQTIPAAIFFGLTSDDNLPDLSRLANQREALLLASLERAIQSNLIPKEMENQIDAFVEALKRLAEILAERGAEDPDEYSVKGVVDLIEELNESQRRKFLRAHTRRAWDRARFWKELDEDLLDHAEKIRSVFDLADLTRNHLPMIRHLYRVEEIRDQRAIQDLARKNPAWWRQRLGQEQGVALPKKPDGGDYTPEEYAEELTQVFKRTFPTTAFIQDLKDFEAMPEDQELKGRLEAFFESHRDFNLAKKSVDRYFAESGLDQEQDEEVKKELQSWQRVYKLLPNDDQRHERAIALKKIDTKLDSAFKIANLSRSEFASAWIGARQNNGAMVESEMRREADEIYNRARYMHFMVSATAWNVAAPLDRVSPAVATPAFIPATTGSEADVTFINQTMANLTTLFGEQDYCECEHCQSVLSPAAYLVDLYNKSLDDEARKQLGGRRPDLLFLHLNCQNTNTELPYIDLVNELLERFITVPPAEAWQLQTTFKSEDLALRPQNEYSSAYVQLAKAIFPFSLPWDKWFAEARLYLDYMEMPLYKLIEAFPLEDDQSLVTDARERRRMQLRCVPGVRAMLGLAVPAFELITGSLTENLTENFGLADDDLEQAKPVRLFMRQLGFWDENEEGDTGAADFILLRQILETQYVKNSNPNQDIHIRFGDDAPCAFSDATLENITKDTIVRVSKFEHLRRNLGWTPQELHQAMVAFSKAGRRNTDLQSDAINEDFLRQISHLVRLQMGRKRISTMELLSWWGPMETGAGLTPLSPTYQIEREKPRTTLYEEVFLDKSLFSEQGSFTAENSEQHYFALNADKTELGYMPQESVRMIVDHKAAVSAALGLTEDDLIRAMNYTTEYCGSGKELLLANLSAIHRVVSMARYLGLTIREFVLARELIGIEPFAGVPANGAVNTTSTLLFIEAIEQIRRSPFSIQDLAYLWIHRTENEKELELVQAQIENYVLRLKEALGNIQEADLERAPDDAGESLKMIRSLLEQIGLRSRDIDYVEGVVRTGVTSPQRERLKLARIFQFIAIEQRESLLDLLIDNRPPQLDKESYQRIIDALTPCQRFAIVISQELQGFLGTPANTIRQLLAFILSGTSSEYVLLHDFIAWMAGEDSITDESMHTHLHRLMKIGQLIDTWKLTAEEIEHIYRYKDDFHQFDWNDIPVGPGATNPPTFEQWAGLAAYVEVRDNLTRQPGDLLELFRSAQVANHVESILDALALLLNLPKAEVLNITGELGLISTGTSPQLADGALANGEALLPVIELAQFVRQSGRSATVLRTWVGNPDRALELGFPHQQEQSRDLMKYKIKIVDQIRNAVKAQGGEETWREVAREFQDRMRILQRDRLVDFIIGPPRILPPSRFRTYIDQDELFAFLLIDSRMNPCMDTTRLKQAVSSTQLFIHRILMGLEPSVVYPADQLEELRTAWKWKKTYRVWEAHRKVFLFPENWIEPELRDNKSPFFEEFESELAQSEIDERSIEKAFKNYLRKLDEVAKLQIVAFLEDDQQVFHLVARTAAKPNIYYYRQRIQEGIWTPWGKIDVDIEADHLLLIKHQGVVHLFWPTFKEGVRKLGKDNPNNQRNEKHNYRPYYEIKLSWTKYEEGFWSPRFETRDSIEFLYEWSYQEAVENPLSLVSLNFETLDDQLRIQVDAWAHGKETITRADWDDTELEIFFNKLKQKVNKIKMHGEVSSPWPEILNSMKTHHRVMVDLLETLVSVILYRESGLNDAAKLIDDFANFPNIQYSHLHGDTQANHGLSNNNDLDLVDSLVSELGYDPRTATGLKNGIDYKKMTYYSLSSSETTLKELVNGHKNTFIQRPIGQFLFVGCNDSAETVRYLGKEAFLTDENASQKTMLPWGTKPSFEMYHKGSQNFLKINAENAAGYEYEQELFSNIQDHFELLKSDWSVGDEQAQSLIINTFQGQTWVESVILPIYPSFTFQTSTKAFLVRRVEIDGTKKFLFQSHYHPFVCDFRKKMLHDYGQDGIEKFDQLLTLGMQYAPVEEPNHPLIEFDANTLSVANPEFQETVEFNYFSSAYGLYNWEIFFHIPFTIATRLAQNKKFAEAQHWFHYIFNPLASFSLDDSDAAGQIDAASKFWNVLPLHQLGQPWSLVDAWRLLSFMDLPMEGGQAEALDRKLLELAKDPFQPHRIARLRLGAYQKAVVMKYLDNLIAWADDLFSKDTIESINEATHLYILIARILGQRPKLVPASKRAKPAHGNGSTTFATLLDISDHSPDLEKAEVQLLASGTVDLDPDALIFVGQQPFPLESWYFTPATPPEDDGGETGTLVADQPIFCVPHNEKLLTYWDTLADRLFKIRNCRNIEGVMRELPIFEPPIDPGFLVRGQALGVDISELLSDLFAPLPPYHFRVMLQKANEFCADVRSLGSALLSAMEKRDAEALSLLRAGHEQQMLELTKIVKTQQIKELRENLKSVRVSLDMAEARLDYYASRPFENQNEKSQVSKLNTANDFQIASQIVAISASLAYLIPQFHLGVGPPTTEAGGKQLGGSLELASRFLGLISSIYSHEANMHGIQGSRERRMDDWQFQARQAEKEIKQLEKQELAAEIRLSISERELENHKKQLEQADEVETFMRSKFTNQELYHWMVSEVSSLYFQTYRLAIELAQIAQRCYRHELGDKSASLIMPIYWDDLKKGLLAGEKLQFDLRRMEDAYLRNNNRELELTKHISLKALNPLELDRLRYTGRCNFEIPELLFDLDHPGHYFRRIKSLSVSIPSVVGPYSGVHGTLRLTASETRTEPTAGDEWLELDSVVESIALSSAQNDSGLFELNHNDERYLPFEMRGVISRWELDFPSKLELFDHATISDVILHMRYTARMDDSGNFQTIVNDDIQKTYNSFRDSEPKGMAQRLDLRREFPDLWHKFTTSAIANGLHEIELTLSREHFPYLLRPVDITVENMTVLCKLEEAATSDSIAITLDKAQTNDPQDPQKVTLSKYPGDSTGMYFISGAVAVHGLKLPGTPKFKIKWVDANIIPIDQLTELLLVLHYRIPE